MTLRDEIRALLLSAFYAPLRLRDDTPLLDERILDVEGLRVLAAHIEKLTGLRIELRDVRPEHFGSVAAMLRYVDRRRAEAPPTTRTTRRAPIRRRAPGR